MAVASILLINRFHSIVTNVSAYLGGGFTRTIHPGFNSFYFVQYQNFEDDQNAIGIINVKNYVFPTLRSCSKTFIKSFSGFYSYTTIRFGIPNTYEGSGRLYVSFEGVSEDENVIKRLFDNLPNFFSSFEEESSEQ